MKEHQTAKVPLPLRGGRDQEAIIEANKSVIIQVELLFLSDLGLKGWPSFLAFRESHLDMFLHCLVFFIIVGSFLEVGQG